MTSFDEMFELAIDLRDKGELRDAVGVLIRIVDNYPINETRIAAGVHSVLAGVYYDLEEYDNALENFKKASNLNPKSELASLGLYITYLELDRDKEAIGELIRYLKSYPAKMYRDTLEELLEGLEKGYMTNYEKEIKELAKINGVKL